MFSQRTAWVREEAPLAQAVAARRAQGLPLIDLAAANPTRCGLLYDAASLLAPLDAARSLDYEPAPFGVVEARAAVCAYYRDHGAAVGAEQVCLTTSTSEAYSFLFRLLCDAGDEVLIAQPSYPLFEFLADLDDVRLVSYPLFYDHGWQIEPGALAARITERTRAIVVVHPNNPTGHYCSPGERAVLEELCHERGLALIVDEVFLDYPLAVGRQAKSFAAGNGLERALTFVLSGLSKVAALPQMKASWIVTRGPTALRDEALARLELIADTFLSMNALVQQALPAWLAGRGALQEQIAARTRCNLARLDVLLAAQTLASRLSVEAGWYAILLCASAGFRVRRCAGARAYRAMGSHHPPGPLLRLRGRGMAGGEPAAARGCLCPGASRPCSRPALNAHAPTSLGRRETGLLARSAPMVVARPWPAITRVSSGSGSRRSRIERRILAPSPPGRSVRPMLPAKSVSPASSSFSSAKCRQMLPSVMAPAYAAPGRAASKARSACRRLRSHPAARPQAAGYQASLPAHPSWRAGAGRPG